MTVEEEEAVRERLRLMEEAESKEQANDRAITDKIKVSPGGTAVPAAFRPPARATDMNGPRVMRSAGRAPLRCGGWGGCPDRSIPRSEGILVRRLSPHPPRTRRYRRSPIAPHAS